MRRFLLFAGDNYYPGGGWSDFIGDYDNTEKAFAALKRNQRDWYQVIDTTTMEEVEPPR